MARPLKATIERIAEAKRQLEDMGHVVKAVRIEGGAVEVEFEIDKSAEAVDLIGDIRV